MHTYMQFLNHNDLINCDIPKYFCALNMESVDKIYINQHTNSFVQAFF
jgi:hypothetical protein